MSITILKGQTRKSVGDVMSSPVITVRDTDTYKQIVEVLLSSRISAAPVVAADDTVLGVVSESDLILKQEGHVPAQGLHPVRRRRQQAKAEQVFAGQLMSTPVIQADEDTSIAEAARTMQKHGVKHLMVIDRDGRVQGIISRGDLLKVFLCTDKEIRDEIVEDVIKHEMMIDTVGLTVAVTDGRVTLSGSIERRSDIERLVRLVQEVDGIVDQGIYSQEHTAATYTELLERARRLLEIGESVILDASWRDAQWRTAASAVADVACADLIQLRCVLPLARSPARIAARRVAGGDTSDADERIAETIAALFHPWPGAVEVATVDDPGGSLTRVRAAVA